MTNLGPRRVGHDHPAIAGHFPGDPLVPGVVILEEVYDALVAAVGPGRLVEVRSVKFLAPLRPDKAFEVTIEPGSDGRYRFACIRDDCVLVQGQLQLAADAPEPAQESMGGG